MRINSHDHHEESSVYRFLAASILFGACAVNNSAPLPGEGAVDPPMGAPRAAKGKLPMAPGMMPKTVTAVKEKNGKPEVAKRSPVSASGTFELSLEVGVRYTFVITLVDDSMITLFAEDAADAYYSWLPIGNSLDGSLVLDFGTLTIVDGVFVSNTVLLYTDWDEDGVADFDDADDDNDGIDDEYDFDIDGDGIEDDYLDADGDGECDIADDDDDNDGISDADDADDDGDGIDDADEDDPSIDIDGDGDDDTGDDGDDGGDTGDE